MRGLGQLVVGDLPAAEPWRERPRLLRELAARAPGGRAVVVTPLVGRHGTGKTPLAAAYAALRIQHGWPVVVWAAAETEAAVVSTLDRLAVAGGLCGPDAEPGENARVALRWLSNHAGPCLLVFDGAADADLVRAWTPPGGSVHTVVTTIHRELGALGGPLDVPVYTAAEAVTYLCRRTGLDDRAGAADLAVHLGRLPLALALAAALIGTGRRYRSFAEYRQASVDRSESTGPGDAGVMLSLDDLGGADPDGVVRRLLDLLAVLAPTGADRVLVRHLWHRSQPPTWRKAGRFLRMVQLPPTVEELVDRSLVTPAADGRIVVHRLVRHVVRQQIGDLDAATARAAEALGDACGEVGASWATRTLIAEYAAHAGALAAGPLTGYTRKRLVPLRLWMQEWLENLHDNATVAALGPSLLADCERLLAPDDASTTTARTRLLTAYQEVGRHDEAIELGTRTLAAHERLWGTDHPGTLESRDTLALLYLRAKRLDDAIGMYSRVLTERYRVLGLDHADTLCSRLMLAVAYDRAGRLDEAVTLVEHTLADCERALGPDHVLTQLSRRRLDMIRADPPAASHS